MAVHKAVWKVWKYDKDGKLIEYTEHEDNILVNVGIEEIWKLVTGSGGTAFDSTAEIWVGDDNTAEDPNQTDLQAVVNGTNYASKAMDTGYPSVSGTTVSFRATFGSTEANFNWEEVAVKNSAGVMMNRKVQSLGTKTSGTTWTIQVDITLS